MKPNVLVWIVLVGQLVGRPSTGRAQLAPAALDRATVEAAGGKVVGRLEPASGEAAAGAVLGSNAYVSFPTSGRFNPRRGTVSFRVQPAWAGNDGKEHAFFHLGNGNAHCTLFKTSSAGLRFVYKASPARYYACELSAADWQPGQWHNVLAGWVQNYAGDLLLLLEVDGRRVLESGAAILDPVPATPEENLRLAAHRPQDQAAGVNNATLVSGTWALQQAGSTRELESFRLKWIDAALKTPQLRGFCLRVPWKAIDGDFSLLDAGLKIAREHNLDYSVRFMAGRHTPARVFDKGCAFYTKRSQTERAEKVPAPFNPDGSPNTIFEEQYEALVAGLATWCRKNHVHLLHLAWYGQDWAELNHGKEVRALPGYSFENWLKAHKRLIDIGLKYAAEGLAVELPFSGYGPCAEAASVFADHVIDRIGPSRPLFFCQSNGWGPNGDWGAPNKETEANFDKVWSKPICRGEQMIQPRDYDWSAVFEKLYQNQATYCEVYTPSFTMEHKAQLAEEIRKLAEHCKKKTPLP